MLCEIANACQQLPHLSICQRYFGKTLYQKFLIPRKVSVADNKYSFAL